MDNKDKNLILDLSNSDLTLFVWQRIITSPVLTRSVSDIKSALNLFGNDKQSHRAAGDFLYISAKQKGNLDSREQVKAQREVGNVVEGHYDHQQKQGFSMRR